MTPVVDIQLENYILKKELGRGDLTTTYEAERVADGSIVAVKVVAPQFTFDRLFVQRLKDLARQAVRLEHPNIVRTFEAGEEGDVVYVARELIDGRPLARVIEEEGPFSPQRMLTIARQIASALDYAHQKSVTHGDLSANRVYIGPNDHAIVADFGQTQAMVGTSLVKQGFAVGSPEIIAPERVHGQGASRHSDYYSLGILCYQMLAGEPPFTGSPTAVLHAQAYEQPRPLHLVNPGISVPLSETIGRMLAKGLELRYNTGSEFSRALAVAIEGTAPIRAPATVVAAQMKEAGFEFAVPWWKRPWVWGILAVLVVVALLVAGFLAVYLWSAKQLPAQTSPPDTRPAAAVAATPTPVAVITTAPQPVTVFEPTSTPAVVETAPTVVSTHTPAPTPTPAFTPTPLSLPTPGPPVIANDSPFTNLRLSHGITNDNQPTQTGLAFAPGPQPIYLFFDFDGMEPGTPWTHRWTWGDTELGAYTDAWPESYSSSGTAWIYYSPPGGFLPGPYQITLEIQGQVVGTATFVVETGGL